MTLLPAAAPSALDAFPLRLPMPAPLLAEIPFIAVVAVIGAFILTAVIVVGGLVFAHRRQALWHETARIALEKGQPLPPLPESPAASAGDPRSAAREDLRSGMISLATGIGLFLFLDAMFGRWMAYVGAIPAFVGLALIVYALISLATQRKDSPASSDRP